MCESIPNSKVILKSMIGPDDISQEDRQEWVNRPLNYDGEPSTLSLIKALWTGLISFMVIVVSGCLRQHLMPQTHLEAIELFAR